MREEIRESPVMGGASPGYSLLPTPIILTPDNMSSFFVWIRRIDFSETGSDRLIYPLAMKPFVGL